MQTTATEARTNLCFELAVAVLTRYITGTVLTIITLTLTTLLAGTEQMIPLVGTVLITPLSDTVLTRPLGGYCDIDLFSYG